MKRSILSLSRLSFPLATALAALLVAPSGFASPYYWDIDGATPGAGGATPSSTWTASTTNWSLSPNGDVVPPAYTTLPADDLFFSAGVGATGAATISLTSTQDASSLNFQEGTVTISGAGGIINLGGAGGNVIVNNGATAAIGSNTGTIIGGAVGLTKSGIGTLTLNGTLTNTFNGSLNANGGTLVLDFVNMATPIDLITSTNTLGFGGGFLNLRGLTGVNDTFQTLSDVTVNPGGGGILINPNGGTSTALTLGTLTATASGGSLVLGKALSAGAGSFSITTTSGTLTNGIYSGRMIFANGTAGTGFDWAANNGGAGPDYTLSAYSAYTPLDTATSGDVTDTNNSTISASATLPAASNRITNTLKFDNPATAQILALGAGNTLTLSSGGLLFTGTSVTQAPRITEGTITVGNGSGSYDLVVHTYSANPTNGGIGIGLIGTNLAFNTTISSVIANNDPLGANNPVTLVKNGPGSLLLSGANTFTGGIVVNEGHLAFNVAGAQNNNPITFNASSFLHTFTTSSTSGSITLNNNCQLTILNNNSSYTVTGQVTGTGGISVANGGQGAITVNLNATNNNFTGPVQITHNNGTQAATINVGSLADTSTLGEGKITFGAGTASSISHNFGLGSTATAPLILNNRRFEMASIQVNQQINNASTQALTINTDLLVTGTRGKNLVLGGAGVGLSTFAGAISNHPTPTAPGTIPIAVRTTAVVAAGGALTLASVEGIVVGATITGTGITAGTTIASVNPFTRQVTLSAATTGGIALGTNFTIPNVVNSVSITKSGTGTWVLSGNNSYTGPTHITAGTLNIQNANALGATSTGTLVANAAALQLQGGFSFAAEPLTLTPGAGGTPMLLNVSGDNTWNGPITSNTATVANVSRLESNSGTMTVAGSVTFTGSAHQLVLQGNGDVTVSGQITGVGRLTSSSGGTGIRTVNNDTNNFTGATGINGSTLAFTSIENVGATSSSLGSPALADATIQLAATTVAGTLRYVGTTPGGHTSDRVINLNSTTANATIEANGTGPLVLTATNTATGAGIKTLILSGTNTGGNSIGAIIDNSVTNTTSLTKDGLGTWILTGANTYTGATTVAGGKLAVNGSTDSASAVTVGNGGTLGGTGTIGGSVTVESGGNLDPGASPGTLSIGGSLDISAPAAGPGQLFYELDALTKTNDKIAVTGTLTIGGGALGFSDFAFTNIGGLQAGTYRLITSGGLSGTLDPADLSGAVGSFTGKLEIIGNDLELVVTPAILP